MAQSAGSMPWNPDSTKFPSRRELVPIEGAPEGAAWVWGKDDQLGRLNLLTPTRVKAAAKEIQSGEIVPMNLPTTDPNPPGFNRQQFKHTIKTLAPGMAYDDLYDMNTQGGTQWDGFRHFAHAASQTFYNGCKGADIEGDDKHKCSIHHWAQHGIAGRGVLIDYLSYAKKNGTKYDVFSQHSITWDELNAAGKDQGIDIRPAAQGGDIQIGDLLFVRSGFNEAYSAMDKESWEKHTQKGHGIQYNPDEQLYAGLAQEDKMLDWLHDCYFAAAGGDAPSFETWPSKESYFLHEHLLALWGLPIGEMVDLEKLAQTCKEKKRWFFFFTSAPFNTPGGVASFVNGTAIF